jgi:hypothetical protein
MTEPRKQIFENLICNINIKFLTFRTKCHTPLSSDSKACVASNLTLN